MAYDFSPAAVAQLLTDLTARCNGQFEYFTLSGDARRLVLVENHPALNVGGGLMRVTIRPEQARLVAPNLKFNGAALTIGWTAVYQRPDVVYVGAGGATHRKTFGRRPFQLYAVCDPNLEPLAKAFALYAARDTFDQRDAHQPVLNFTL